MLRKLENALSALFNKKRFCSSTWSFFCNIITAVWTAVHKMFHFAPSSIDINILWYFYISFFMHLFMHALLYKTRVIREVKSVHILYSHWFLYILLSESTLIHSLTHPLARSFIHSCIRTYISYTLRTAIHNLCCVSLTWVKNIHIRRSRRTHALLSVAFLIHSLETSMNGMMM
jgi:hypothetical protein